MTATPNHALQRTAPGVTACAPARRPAPAAFPHRLRRPPQSLSLGSLGGIEHHTNYEIHKCIHHCSRGSRTPARRLAHTAQRHEAFRAGGRLRDWGGRFVGIHCHHQREIESDDMLPPNHALQRTAPCVTAPASAATFPPTMQVPRRTPRSLSLGSLGVATRFQ